MNIIICIGGIAALFTIVDFFLKWRVFKLIINGFKKSIIFLYQTYHLFFLKKKDFIYLGLLSQQEMGYKQLFFAEKKLNCDSRIIESCLKSIIRLRKAGLIEKSGKIGGLQDLQDELFKTTARGIEKSKKIKESIRERADKLNQEISKINSGPLVRAIRNKTNELFDNICFSFDYPEDIDLPDEASYIIVKAFCRSCMLPLKEEYGPAGIYSGIQMYHCPSCGLKIEPKMFNSLESQAKSIFIKKRLGLPYHTPHDEIF